MILILVPMLVAITASSAGYIPSALPTLHHQNTLHHTLPYQHPLAYSPFYRLRPRLPHVPLQTNVLKVEVDEAVSMEKAMVRVPLLLVPQSNLQVYHGSPYPVYAPSYDRGVSHAAMPAVQVRLQRPLLLTSVHQKSVMAPAHFTVLRHGYLFPLDVRAVVAPIPVGVPFTPSTPLRITTFFVLPALPNTIGVPVAPPPHPIPAQPPKVDHKPLDGEKGVSVVPPPTFAFEPPLIQIPSFPKEIATPPVLLVPNDLGSRDHALGPVLPAGIVQSTQPHFVFSVFHNSKESPVLHIQREEAAAAAAAAAFQQ